MSVAIGEVVSIEDKNDSERIRVRIRPTDNIIHNDEEVPYAYPLLPKMLHIKPKVHEAVLIFFDMDSNQRSQRYYIGPLISQPQFFEYQAYGYGATNGLKGQIFPDSRPPKDDAKGAFANDDDIAICGRRNCDIILSDNDIRIRCGVHYLDNEKVRFNGINPTFIKLKYYQDPLPHQTTEVLTNGNVSKKTEYIGSVATICADKINLVTTSGDPYIDRNDTKESISDDEIKYLLDKAHRLPYGDNLCEFLCEFLEVFKEHTHNDPNKGVVRSPQYEQFNAKYGKSQAQLESKILSEHIHIT